MMKDLSRVLQSYRADSALARISALGLVAENAGNIISAELLANVAICSLKAASGGKSLSRKDLQKLLRSNDLAAYAWVNDPESGPLVQEIAYFGGAYRVLTSQEKDLKVTLDALLTASEHVGTDAQRSPIRRTIRAVLALSDSILREAGLSRGTRAGDAATLVVPAEADLDRLAAATVLTLDQVNQLLRAFGCSLDDLESLTTGLERHKLSAIDAEGRPLRNTPFVRYGSRLAVPALSLVAPSLVRTVVDYWRSLGLRTELATALQRFALGSVSESLDALGLRPLGHDGEPQLPIGDARWYRMDTDKVLVALVVSDPLADDESVWRIPPEDLSRTLRAIETHEVAKPEPANELLILVIFQACARPAIAAAPTPTYARLLSFSIGDLQTIRSTRETDPLALWTYAETRERTTAQTRIVATDPLDEFAMYQGRGKSFRFTDEATPDVIVVSPGTSLSLRMDAFTREDLHPLVDPDGRVGTYVRTQQDVPIYGRLHPLNPLQMLIELPSFTAFVSVKSLSGNSRQAQYELTELVSYWVWQIAVEFGLQGRPLVVNVEIPRETAEAWSGTRFNEADAQEPGITVSAASRVVTVTVGPGAVHSFDTADNVGERVLVAGLATAMFDVMRGEHLDEERLAVVVDRVAPLGQKKKLVIFSSDDVVVRMDSHGLPRPRLLQDAATQWVRSELTPDLIRARGIPIGAVDPAEREGVLRQLVDDLFAVLQTLVSTLRPDGLIRCLLTMDDALFTDYERQRRMIPTEMACFADVPTAERRLADTVPRIATTSLAHRFLIEYVVAQPPTGLRPLSLSAYDEMIAVAAELIMVANDDDLLHYELVRDLGLEVRPDGRLAKDDGAVALAREAFASAYAAQELRRAVQNFARMWRSPDPDAVEDGPPEHVDEAFRAEFGWSLRELAVVWRILLELQTVQGAPQPFRAEEVAAVLDAECGCGVERALDLLASLTLRVRDDYLSVPDGHTLQDILPWRFSRSLSLLRRPLVSWSEDGNEVLYWTRKGALRASDYLFNAVFDRRLKPRSQAMAQLMGRLGVESGSAWLNTVEQAVRDVAPFVRTNVDRIGSRRLVDGGRNLGDIDVLAFDSERGELWAIEVKNFEPARTPYEARSEMLDFEEAVQKHQVRLQWLDANRDEVATALSGQAPERPIETRGAIVVSNESLVRHLRTFGLTVSSLSDLLAAMAR